MTSLLKIMKGKKMQFLKNLVIYDKVYSKDLSDLANEAGLKVFNYHELMDEMRASHE